ncbi:MAG: LacI family DNA-binding transcriptional regulator [Opitutae bacterium]|nr:LacI family DNA-binding transcriptional regulator [Opitutae bacterium]
MKSRVTLKEIARRADLHFTTVSMALRGDHRINAKTRARVESLAEKMGYVPDPMLKALSAYRTSSRPHAFQATLGWINNNPLRVNAKAKALAEYHEGARRRATELGYALEDFWTYDPALKGARLARVLQYRNIHGLLLAPQPRAQTALTLPWEQFSTVTFGYSLVKPQLHAVTNHQYRTIRRALGELRALGYRRVGLWLYEEHDLRVNENWSAGFWVEYHRYPVEERVTPVFFKDLDAVDRDQFSAWLAREKPEVVITGDGRVRGWLGELKYNVPADVGLSMLSVERGDEVLSGTYENSLMVGSAAVDLLVGMLHRHERGIPEVPQWVLVDSVWYPGTTLRRLRAAEPQN